MDKEKQKRNAVYLAILLIAVVLIALFGYQWLSKRFASSNITVVEPTPTQAHNTQSPQTEANIAPDFTVYNANGNEVKLSDYFGKPIVLNFWASWCGPCQNEMPEFQLVYTSKDQAVVFLMINITDGARETLESAQEFISKEGYTLPVYFDTELSAADAYSITTIPITYFIDAQGHIVAIARGSIDEATLMEGISMIAE